MILLFLYIWIVIGLISCIYAEKIMNYAMHKRYKLATPVLEELDDDDFWFVLLLSTILGPFSLIMTLIVVPTYLPKGTTIKEAIKAECGVNHNAKK